MSDFWELSEDERQRGRLMQRLDIQSISVHTSEKKFLKRLLWDVQLQRERAQDAVVALKSWTVPQGELTVKLAKVVGDTTSMVKDLP